METDLIAAHRDTITDSLRRRVGPSTAFAPEAGAGTASPVFVVFAQRACPRAAAAASDLIRTATGGALAPVVLLHKPSDIATRAADQQWFFYHALRSWRLCLDKTAVPNWPHDYLPRRDADGARAFWLKCEAVAAFNISAAAESAHLEVELARIALLHEAAAQVSLGIARVFSGYTASGLGLRHLLAFCSHFTTLPGTVFPQRTSEEQSLFRRLAAPPSMLRHWTRLGAPEAEFERLLEACRRYLDQAAGLASAALEKL